MLRRLIRVPLRNIRLCSIEGAACDRGSSPSDLPSGWFGLDRRA